MRRDAAATGAKLREQMRQLMAQSAVNLSLAVSAETAVEQNRVEHRIPRGRRRCEDERDHSTRTLRGQCGRAVPEQEVAGQGFERRIAAGRLFNERKVRVKTRAD